MPSYLGRYLSLLSHDIIGVGYTGYNKTAKLLDLYDYCSISPSSVLCSAFYCSYNIAKYNYMITGMSVIGRPNFNRYMYLHTLISSNPGFFFTFLMLGHLCLFKLFSSLYSMFTTNLSYPKGAMCISKCFPSKICPGKRRANFVSNAINPTISGDESGLTSPNSTDLQHIDTMINRNYESFPNYEILSEENLSPYNNRMPSHASNHSGTYLPTYLLTYPL